MMTYQEELNNSHHDPERMLYLLRNHSDEIDPSVNYNQAIRGTSQNGHLEVVKELLKDPRVDPTDDDNFAIQMASRNGHLEVVKLLLKDPRVDPTDDGYLAARWAFENDHYEVFELLKSSYKVREK